MPEKRRNTQEARQRWRQRFCRAALVCALSCRRSVGRLRWRWLVLGAKPREAAGKCCASSRAGKPSTITSQPQAARFAFPTARRGGVKSLPIQGATYRKGGRACGKLCARKNGANSVAAKIYPSWLQGPDEAAISSRHFQFVTLRVYSLASSLRERNVGSTGPYADRISQRARSPKGRWSRVFYAD